MMGLPDGFEVGHWTDRERLTGATVVLTPPGTVAAGEVRGGAPGTRETDLLSPASSAAEVHAVLFTGGSAFGLAAADGVVSFLAERGRGSATPVGPVPLVPAAVVFDLMLGAEDAYPDRDAGYAACAAAAATFQRGSVGAGTGCTVGKLLGPAGATKAGVGYAAFALGGAVVGALAVVNALGDVRDSDGALLTGVWRDGRYVPTVELLLEGQSMPSLVRQATTLVCILTDAALTKTDCWRVARAGSAGVARAVDPSATALDGDVVFCLASGREQAHPVALAAIAAHAAAEAIRDGVRSATGAGGAPAVHERR
jgi:L-aminopeptidase/D-esterase-like protein